MKGPRGRKPSSPLRPPSKGATLAYTGHAYGFALPHGALYHKYLQGEGGRRRAKKGEEGREEGGRRENKTGEAGRIRR